MKIFFLFLMIVPLKTFGSDIRSQSCTPPSRSQWNISIERLVKATKNIILVEFVSASPVSAPPDIKRDFPIQGGIAADGRRDQFGKMKALNDRGDTNWRFKVIQSLKGDFRPGKDFSFVSIKRTSISQPELTPILCDYPLAFEQGRIYLIFVGSYNPQGYRFVSGREDVFVQNVLSLIEKNK